MDRQIAKQGLINQRQLDAAVQYPALWSKMISEWSQPGADDCSWLMYSANYLLRTGNIRWAIDPLTLKNRVASAPGMQTVGDLEGLSFVILTHHHADHLDLSLLHDLRDLPIRWIIPEVLLQNVLSKTGISEERVLIPKVSVPIEFESIRIVPFEGLHGDVPAMAYLVEFNNKRWVFPGDTRTYDPTRLPSFDRVEGVFAHLWLGKARALDEKPALLEQFCRFFLDLKPRRLVVTHLEELGRLADDYWDRDHFRMVEKWFQEQAPDIQVECRLMGDRISL
jgi:hypothetical protein